MPRAWLFDVAGGPCDVRPSASWSCSSSGWGSRRTRLGGCTDPACGPRHAARRSARDLDDRPRARAARGPRESCMHRRERLLDGAARRRETARSSEHRRSREWRREREQLPRRLRARDGERCCSRASPALARVERLCAASLAAAMRSGCCDVQGYPPTPAERSGGRGVVSPARRAPSWSSTAVGPPAGGRVAAWSRRAKASVTSGSNLVRPRRESRARPRARATPPCTGGGA